VNNKTTTGNGVAYSLYHDTTANTYRWLAVNGQGPGGTANANYFMEDNTSTMATTIGTRFIEHQWFDIRAVAYGTRTQPTYYDFMVVKFTRDYLQPCLYADETKLSVEEVGAMRSFWAGLVKNISYNAIMPGQRDTFKGMTVLRRFRFTLQSSPTTDSDRNPNMRIVKLFQKHYQVGDYNWGKENTQNAAAVDSAQWVQNLSAVGDLRDAPNEKQRTFLIVRASNTTENATANKDADNTPSFDLIIRKQVRFATI
jgi:hypothetical protein